MTRRAPLRALWAAHGISLTGNVVSLVALPLYVLDETSSASLTGLMAFFAVLPVVLGGALGGVLVDRVGYRRASIGADLVSAASIGAVPLLAGTVGLPLWALFGLVFATGLFDTPGQTARSAVLPELAEHASVPLERAVGTFEGLERAARLLGAPVAGVLVAWLGALNALAVNAASFGVSVVLVAALVPATDVAGRSGDEPLSPRVNWRELREGLAFLYHQPLLRAMVALLIATNALDAAWTQVILPVYAERNLDGATALGLLISATGTGALIGSLGYGAVGHRLPRRAVYAAAFMLAGGPRMLVLATEPGMAVCLTTLVVAGIAVGAINPIISTVRLERTPIAMRARVYGAMGAAAWSAMPLGAVLGGLAIERAGLSITLVAMGVTYLALASVPLLGRVWSTMNRTESRPASERAPVPVRGSDLDRRPVEHPAHGPSGHSRSAPGLAPSAPPFSTATLPTHEDGQEPIHEGRTGPPRRLWRPSANLKEK